jgi:anti-sigma regulatory factor (Ser/Thr protein kinase)
VTQREQRSFGLDPAEVASARRFAAAVLEGWGCAADDVVLAVDELASNAVLHARTPFTVTLWRAGHQLTVEVADQNPRLPIAAQPPPGALRGRGLMLVSAVCKTWGARPESADGKLVWAEFDCAGPGSREDR